MARKTNAIQAQAVQSAWIKYRGAFGHRCARPFACMLVINARAAVRDAVREARVSR